MTFSAGLVLGLGIGSLATTPLCKVIVAAIGGRDWRKVLHDVAV